MRVSVMRARFMGIVYRELGVGLRGGKGGGPARCRVNGGNGGIADLRLEISERRGVREGNGRRGRTQAEAVRLRGSRATE